MAWGYRSSCQHLFCFADNRFGGEASVSIDLGVGCRGAKGIDTDELAFEAKVFIPTLGNASFDSDAGSYP